MNAVAPNKSQTQTADPQIGVKAGSTRPEAAIRIVTAPKGEPPPRAAETPSPIVAFIDLEAEARNAKSLDDLRFIIVNSTRKLAAFDQSFLLECGAAGEPWRISASSSVANVDRDSAVAQSIEAWINDTTRLDSLDKALTGVLKELSPRAESMHGLWTPVRAPGRSARAGLLSLSASNWLPGHITLMTALCEAYGHAWGALAPAKTSAARRVLAKARASQISLGVLALLVAASFIPVPLSALAPAEIVGAAPTLINAPIDGVIKDIFVPPGASVQAGAPLFSLVDTKLRNDVELAARARSVAEAKYFKVLQSAVSTQKDLQDLSIAKAELSMAEVELANARDLLARSLVKAPRGGVLVYSAKSDWLGKPVGLGERIMEIANPDSIEMRIDVPVSDAIALEAGGDVKLFLDGEPLHAIEAKVDRIGYRAVSTPDRQLVFRTFARFNSDERLRLGLRGTARLQGRKVALGFYVFRRPLAVLRQKIGL
jgi:multidrug efflux pump subunit AcrA (membrane-fusion protein)